MPTPTYKGNGQPQADNSFWSGLASWFGGAATPAYKGVGQPSSVSSRFLGAAAPPYKSAPNSSQGITARVIDPNGFPQGPFAIIVPRSVVPSCDVSEPQQ